MKLQDAISGKTPINEASAKDLSATWSRALTGGVPAASLITETMPITIKSDIAKIAEYFSTLPDNVTYYTTKQLKQMEKQLNTLDDAVNHNMGNTFSKVLTSYSEIINKNKAESDLIGALYGEYVDKTKEGYYVPKGAEGSSPKKEDTPKGGVDHGDKKVVKKQTSAKANKTKFTYEDGTEKVVDGIQ